MSFVDSNFDIHSTLSIAVMYTISCYVEPCYNGTRVVKTKKSCLFYNITNLLIPSLRENQKAMRKLSMLSCHYGRFAGMITKLK